MTRLREVTSDELVGGTAPQQEPVQQPNIPLQLLLLALKTLSQRTILAIAALRGLVLAGSVFWLAFTVCQSPDVPKLVGLGLYAGFVLLSEIILLRRK
jgi:hypothetical protein